MLILQVMYYGFGALFYGCGFLLLAKVLREAMNAGEYTAQIRNDDEGWSA
jgi:hypothetical protein